MNSVTLVGRLTKNPELKQTQSGLSTCTFSLAVNRPFTNKQTGQREADFIQCVVWNKQAENLCKYQTKGSQIALSGRIQTRNYENQQGQRVYITEVVADNIEFLTSRNEAQGNQQQPNNNGWESVQNMTRPADLSESDLPF